jgi:hypothetical protein
MEQGVKENALWNGFKIIRHMTMVTISKWKRTILHTTTILMEVVTLSSPQT